jgi:biopolymer transport protein ExbD
MLKKREPPEQGELNLIPMMNLICLLIPFLLLSAQFIQIGIILVQTPRLKNQSSADQKKKKQALNLSVVMTGKGYYVKSRFGSECPPGKKTSDEKLCFALKEKNKFTAQDIKKLQKHLWYLFAKKYKSSQFYENEKTERHTITLVPQHDIKYEAIVETLDAMREIPLDAENPKPPSNVPAGGCAMGFDKATGGWFVKGAKKSGAAVDRACMYHLVTLAIGAT